MNVRCSSRTASSSRVRSISHVMRNDDVATTLHDDPGGGKRGGAAAHVLERGVDAGADDAHRAQVVGEANAIAEPLRQLRAQPLFLVQVLARDHQRQPLVRDVQLFAGHRDRRERQSSSCSAALSAPRSRR